MNKPGCSDVAFANEDKYISCPYVPCNASSCQNFNASSCQGYTPSSAVELGGEVVWMWTDRDIGQVLNSNTNSTTTGDSINASTGELHIGRVTPDMRTGNGSGIFDCFIQSAEGHNCSHGRQEVVIFSPGELNIEGCPSKWGS